jgi:hypothetical protein
MSKKKPSHADAHLVLELYELRREAVMRESRSTIAAWLPRSFADVVAITKLDDPRNAAWRQVSSYFEMAFGFARHGAVHKELLAEACGEGLLLFAKVHPYLARIRDEISPTAFTNAEWVVENTEFGERRFGLFQERLAQMSKAR